MKFYFSSQLVGILMFVFMIVLVAIGLTIGYGWHFVSETIDLVRLKSDGELFSDTAKTVTIMALLLPYLVSAYVAGRVANRAEYLNCIILGLILIGPFAWYYPPTTIADSVFFVLPALMIIVGAMMAHWTRVSDAKRIEKMKAALNKSPEQQ